MESLITTFIGLGLTILLATWTPVLFRNTFVSPPMIAVLAGAAFFGLVRSDIEVRQYVHTSEVLTELALVLAVMGAGLNIDRNFSLRTWASVWRLLGLAMPLSIAVITLLGVLVLRLDVGLALLLAAVLTPTDPVLGGEVGVGPPGRGEEGEVRFALTAESALNDGLAFPFVTLGLLLVQTGHADPSTLAHWFVIDLVWRIALAVAIGVGLAIALLSINRLLPRRFRLRESGDGLVAIGITFLVYGLCQYAGGYGFIAVFCAAVTVRNFSKDVEYHQTMAAFGEQVERIATCIVLILFGGVIAQGALEEVTWRDAVFAVAVLAAARALPVLLVFLGSAQTRRERIALGYFGIRGLGALFYGFYVSHAIGTQADPLWPSLMLVVLLSTFLYGASAGHVMRRLGVGDEAEQAAHGKTPVR